MAKDVKDVKDEIVALLPRLRRFAYSLSGNRQEADDLVQSACERALTRLHQFDPETHLDRWLFRILQNVWIDQKRSAARRPTVNDDNVIELMPHYDRIAERVEARDTLDLVREAIASLPEEQRAVLALVSIDGASYQEAALTLDVPIGTVMSRLARARKKLAAAVADAPIREAK